MPRIKRNAKKSAKKARMREEMHRFKHGQLHSGSEQGPVVKDRKQAIAIALHQSGQSRKVGKKKGRRKRLSRKR